jgi:hypothetical protein
VSDIDAEELAARASVLPEQFADRLLQTDFDAITSARDGGEWGEEIDNLVASLVNTRTPVTRGELEELAALVAAMKLQTTEPMERLVVR